MDILEQATRNLALPKEGEEADWLGRLNKVIRDLNDKKRLVMDELPGPVEGDEYRIVEQNSAKRSYNTAAILHGFQSQGYDLHDLLNMDAVRLSWRWTQLRKAAQMADVELRIAGHEIEDDGDIESPLVGEVWASRMNIEGKQ
jgi:hypothetical protein